MKRIITALIICFSSFYGMAQERISWSESRPLTWSNFEPRKDQGFGYRALTFSGIRYNVETKDGMIEIDVECYFIPSKSWVQKGFEKDYLLRHEQLHFDITELHARKMRKAMEEYEMPIGEFMKRGLAKELEDLYDNIYEEMVAMQTLYDKETDHSLNREAQQKWEEKVASSLAELQEFASSGQ
ncbi:DUF922 domain-containing protein [Halocola ammonii]